MANHSRTYQAQTSTKIIVYHGCWLYREIAQMATFAAASFENSVETLTFPPQWFVSDSTQWYCADILFKIIVSRKLQPVKLLPLYSWAKPNNHGCPPVLGSRLLGLILGGVGEDIRDLFHKSHNAPVQIQQYTNQNKNVRHPMTYFGSTLSNLSYRFSSPSNFHLDNILYKHNGNAFTTFPIAHHWLYIYIYIYMICK